MKSPVELLKEELCTRYGLAPEQISLDVRVKDIPVNLAEVIAIDYADHSKYSPYYGGKELMVSHGKDFNMFLHYPEKEEKLC